MKFTGSIYGILKNLKTISFAKVSLTKQFNLLDLLCCNKFYQYIITLWCLIDVAPRKLIFQNFSGQYILMNLVYKKFSNTVENLTCPCRWPLSTRHTKITLRIISMSCYLFKPTRASQDHETIYLVFILYTTFAKILVSFLQLLNGGV